MTAVGLPTKMHSRQYKTRRPTSMGFGAKQPTAMFMAKITSSMLLLVLLMSLLATMANGVEASSSSSSSSRDEEYYRSRRAASKPWLMKETELFEFPDFVYNQIVALVDYSLGFCDANQPPLVVIVPRTIVASPFTILIVTLLLANAWSWLSYHLSGTWVEASHILVKDTSPKTLKALVGLRDQLGKDAKLFGLTAKQYSQCPSSHQNGDLGRFGRGVMAPPFDKLCFDPSTPLNETIGPVQTQFGYHLIYLRKRKY